MLESQIIVLFFISNVCVYIYICCLMTSKLQDSMKGFGPQAFSSAKGPWALAVVMDSRELWILGIQSQFQTLGCAAGYLLGSVGFI